MSSLNQQIRRIEQDIKSIAIQGATNVALATLEGIRLGARNIKGDRASVLGEIREIGKQLSNARENEPLARNAVKYVSRAVEDAMQDTEMTVQKIIIDAAEEYEILIRRGKEKIKQYAVKALSSEDVVLTHCHSSTTTNALIHIAQERAQAGKEFHVVATETRPLYQGRKTAKELVEADVNVTQIVDSVCASFIVDDRYLPVGAVIVGCDELLSNGAFINKVGTYSISIAAREGKDELYVATTLLKMDPERSLSVPEIEQRDAKEVWEEAPKGLEIINPAFELVSAEYVTGYITEAGVLSSKDLLKTAKKQYPWLFANQ